MYSTVYSKNKLQFCDRIWACAVKCKSYSCVFFGWNFFPTFCLTICAHSSLIRKHFGQHPMNKLQVLGQSPTDLNESKGTIILCIQADF